MRTVTAARSDRSDIFAICELLKKAYNSSVNADNTIAGFKKALIWCDERRVVDMEKITSNDLTAPYISSECLSSLAQKRAVPLIVESSYTLETGIQNAQHLFQLFLNRFEKLLSHETVARNGTVRVTTTSGMTLTSANVLAALQEEEDKRATEQEQRVQVQQQLKG